MSPFSKIPGYVWTVKYDSKTLRVDGQKRFENAMCGRRVLLNTEKKISIFEITRLRVDRALGS